jgi:hypothetical protein
MSLLLTFITSLMLGMKHATDSDHVVAVTAIASTERSVAKATWLGAVWGFGHTLTLLIVGGAIIVFRITFAPRIGLSMEFAVAVMLIVLAFSTLSRFDHARYRRVSPGHSLWEWFTDWQGRPPQF